MDTPASQIDRNRFIDHIASGFGGRNAFFDLLDPMGRSSLYAKPGELSFVHQTAKHEAKKRTFPFLRLSAKDVRNKIMDQKYQT